MFAASCFFYPNTTHSIYSLNTGTGQPVQCFTRLVLYIAFGARAARCIVILRYVLYIRSGFSSVYISLYLFNRWEILIYSIRFANLDKSPIFLSLSQKKRLNFIGDGILGLKSNKPLVRMREYTCLRSTGMEVGKNLNKVALALINDMIGRGQITKKTMLQFLTAHQQNRAINRRHLRINHRRRHRIRSLMIIIKQMIRTTIKVIPSSSFTQGK